jgi:aspartate racemase
MKHIGIVDITTVGACICANEIVSESVRQGLGDKHPEFTMHAFPFDVYTNLIIKRDWKALAEVIVESIGKLQKAGAEFIIIPSNTPHYGFDEIAAKSPLPILNLIELTAAACQQKEFKKVAVLGTKFTMQEGLYDKPLRQRGIIPVIPDAASCEKIHQLIMDEIIPLKETRFTVAAEIAESILKKLSCDAMILGCTELPEVYNEQNVSVPVIDTTRLLAHKALEYPSI